MKKEEAQGVFGAAFVICGLGVAVDAVEGLNMAAVICTFGLLLSGLGYLVSSRL